MNKIALITGSTSGIGLAIAKELLKIDHIKVIVSGRKKEEVEASLADFPSVHASRLDGVELDISDANSIENAFAEIQQKYGRLDILFNNAGVNPYHQSSEESILSAESSTLLSTFHINTVGALMVAQKAVELMKINDFGRIINTSTEMASMDVMQEDYYPIAPSYRISKVALNGVTSLLAKELNGTGITVNSYSPGWTQTKIGGEQAPFTPAEAAETAIYLATSEEFVPNGKFFAEVRKFGGPFILNW